MIAITGASGQLGRLVIEKLLLSHPADQIIATVRREEEAQDLRTRGILVRQGDYDRPETLDQAFENVDRLLMISSSEIGRRVPQHRNVIEAAQRAKVKVLAYTSVLRAKNSLLPVAAEHAQTEELLEKSGLPLVILRNGWYTENYLAALPQALALGGLAGCAGAGRIASACREDYAAAAALAVSNETHIGKVYELAGDESYSLQEMTNEISRQSGRKIAYLNMSREDHIRTLQTAGLPLPVAELIAGADAAAEHGALFDDSHQLSQLIGRATIPLASAIAQALTNISS